MTRAILQAVVLLVVAGPSGAGDDPAPTGQLAIRAVQATMGGPPVGAADVTVQLLHQGVVLETRETRLDEHGVALLEGLPLGIPMQPVVQVLYKGLTYRKAGSFMDAANPHQTLEVECYEATDAEPDWTISMWHVMADRVPGGLGVTEIIVVNSPADRTWVGNRDADDREVTTVFNLHGDAGDVMLMRGFHDWCCTTHVSGRLVNHLPLMPGATEFKFTYRVTGDASNRLDLVAPAPVEHLMVLVPDEIALESMSGLSPMGSEQVAGRAISAFGSHALDQGAAVAVRLAAGPQRLEPEPAATGSAGVARMVAGIGGAAALIAALVVVLRPRRDATVAGAGS